MSSAAQPLDLECRCKSCSLEFHIPDLDKLVSQDSDGFSLSDLSCPNCKSDVNVSIISRKTESADAKFDDVRKRLDQAFKSYESNREDKLANHRLSITIINLLQELARTLPK